MGRREDIVEAAEVLFAEKGFSATSMTEIAEKAGVAKGLIYHHFASKEDLWNQIKWERLINSGLEERIADMVALESVEAFTKKASGEGGYFRFLKDNPGFVRMMSWLNTENTVPICSSDCSPCHFHAEIIATLRKQQQKGIMSGDIDPRFLVVIFVSMCDYWFMAREKFRFWFGDEFVSEGMDQKYIETACRILLKGAREE